MKFEELLAKLHDARRELGEINPDIEVYTVDGHGPFKISTVYVPDNWDAEASDQPICLDIEKGEDYS